MQRDPQVDLIFSHFIPRYEATGIDPNDLRALMPRVTQWQDWCMACSPEMTWSAAIPRRISRFSME